MPGRRCCAGFPLGAASGGHSLVVVSGFLIVVASLVEEHRLEGSLASGVEACGLSCGSWALEHRFSTCGT